MPFLLIGLAALAGLSVVGGTAYVMGQPDTVINLPEDMTQDQLDSVLSSQPASLGDGLTKLSGAAAAAAVIYLIVKKG